MDLEIGIAVSDNHTRDCYSRGGVGCCELRARGDCRIDTLTL